MDLVYLKHKALKDIWSMQDYYKINFYSGL